MWFVLRMDCWTESIFLENSQNRNVNVKHTWTKITEMHSFNKIEQIFNGIFLLLFCFLKKCSSFKIDNPLLMFLPYIAKYLVMPFMPIKCPSTMGLHYTAHLPIDVQLSRNSPWDSFWSSYITVFSLKVNVQMICNEAFLEIKNETVSTFSLLFVYVFTDL